MSTGYVSTLAGKPQNSGYVNGSAEDAQFKNHWESVLITTM